MPQIRVYYVDPDSFTILELKRTGDDDWSDGSSFNSVGAQLAGTSGISANVVIWNYEQKFGQLKVYYTNPEGLLNVVYSNLNEGNWTPRKNINQ